MSHRTTRAGLPMVLVFSLSLAAACAAPLPSAPAPTAPATALPADSGPQPSPFSAVPPSPSPTVPLSPSPAPATATPAARTATAIGRIVLGYGDYSPVADLPLWLGTESLGQPVARTNADGQFTLTNLPVGQVVDVTDDHLTFHIDVTSTGTIDAGTFEYPLIHPGADLTPTPAARVAPPEVHTTLPSGLTIDEYALQGRPSLDPLVFIPVHGTMADIVARHRSDAGEFFPDHSFFNDMHYSMWTEWNGQTLTATETYTGSLSVPLNGVVDVRLGNKTIFTIPVGGVSPLNALRGLWAYDRHWVLEAAYVTQTYYPADNTITLTTTGQVVEDGQLLNTRYGYQQMFGFQLLRGRPFYFYQQAGEIGIAYDGQNMLLGYGAVPHYGCCSYAELNPQPRANRVAFFAQKAGVWYYVEIGAY